MRPYLKFLTALAENNHKDWMDANRKWFLDTREEFLEDVEVLLKQLFELEPELSAFKPKDYVLRQNRDIRFSANKNTYKNNFSAYFPPKGKKTEGPGYYLHIQPGGTYLAGGIWMPSSDTLKKIRKEIDYSGAELERIENNPEFRGRFKAITGEKLKTSPRDYRADHPHIEYLRLKSYTVSAPIPDSMVNSGEFIIQAMDGFRAMKDLIDFLGRAVEDTEDGSGIL